MNIEPENLRDDYSNYYNTGAEAFKNKLTLKDCPYERGSIEGDSWLSGYVAARELSEDLERDDLQGQDTKLI